MSIELTLSKYSHIYGENKSKIYNHTSVSSYAPDIVRLTGGHVDELSKNMWYWTDAIDRNDHHYMIREYGKLSPCMHTNSPDVGVRPEIRFSSIDELKSITTGEMKEFDDGIKLATVYIALNKEREAIQVALKELIHQRKIKPYNSNKLSFPTNSSNTRRNGGIYDSLKLHDSFYYELNGDLYLELKANQISFLGAKLNDGNTYYNGDTVFLKVVPEFIYIDEKNQIAIPEHGWFAGVQFHHDNYNCPQNLDDTDLGQYLKIYGQQFLNLQQAIKEISCHMKNHPKVKIPSDLLTLFQETTIADKENAKTIQILRHQISQLESESRSIAIRKESCINKIASFLDSKNPINIGGYYMTKTQAKKELETLESLLKEKIHDNGEPNLDNIDSPPYNEQSIINRIEEIKNALEYEDEKQSKENDER